MSKLKTPFRYDFVGSFLRPQALKNAKIKFENNEITKEEYDGIVNNEITKLVAKQKELGYHAITDGEFRRTFWHLDFMWGFGGVEHIMSLVHRQRQQRAETKVNQESKRQKTDEIEE